MPNRLRILTRNLLLAVLLSGLSLNALADSAETELTIQAGLAQALTLACDTALNFGITRLTDPAQFSGATLVLSATDGSITGAEADTLSADVGQAGICTLSGSLAPDGRTVSVSFADGGEATLTPNADAFAELDAAGSGTLTVHTFTTDAAPILHGGTSIQIGASLIIPSAPALGGYQGTIQVTVSDDDV